MVEDSIAAIEIDQAGRLHVMPATQAFPFAYREAMEVSWDPEHGSLHSPPPRQWSYVRWFQQIVALAAAQGVRLILHPGTRWSNVPADLRRDLSRDHGQDA